MMDMARLLLYFLREGFRGVSRHKTLNVFAVFIVSLSLFVLGFSRYLTANINNLLLYWEEALEVRLVLKDSVTERDVSRTLDYLRGQQVVDGAKVITPDEAMKFLEKLSPSLRSLSFKGSDNPLPYSFAVKLRKPVDLERVKVFIDDAKRRPEVEEAIFDWEWLGKLKTYSRFLALLGWLLFAALGVASLFTVTAITRIIALSRKEEIAILYSLGATSGSIRGPFITSGLIVGALSSVLSLAFLFAAHFAIRQSMADNFIMEMVSREFLTFGDQAALVAVGTLMGGAGGLMSLGSIHDWRYSRYGG